jgi:hypothetical protein
MKGCGGFFGFLESGMDLLILYIGYRVEFTGICEMKSGSLLLI